jgi:tRNA threonylcarbamoyladenosine biosynthesis protein TsaB
MILLLDTSTSICKLWLADGDDWRESSWDADRELAKGILRYLESELKIGGKSFEHLTGIGVFRGPGSFTGLRIGLTVLNTLADSLQLPIVGETGDDWTNRAVDRLQKGENDKLVLPLYGRAAHVTKPRK